MLYERLSEDIRFVEGINACMNCGICTAICPAAEFYDYDPRMLVNMVQQRDDEVIEELLKSDMIWYCGQCMSCKTRCPRNNCPGLIINVLRKVSQEMGYFTESKKGRQQLAIKRNVGDTILEKGYCIHPAYVKPERHPEQGPVWEWVYNNLEAVYDRFNGNLDKDGPGTLRKITTEILDELKSIFEETGGISLFEDIEKYSLMKAKEMGMAGADDNLDEYMDYIQTQQ